MPDDRKRVLIVDQDRFSSLISKMLVGRFQPETASDGPSAVSALRDNPPDVLVVEESVGGIRLAELVGMSPKYDHIPVILTSSHPSPDSIIRSRNAGISTFLAKPFRPSDLHTRIQAALEETQSPDVGDSGSSPEEDDSVDPEEREQQTQSLRDRVKQIAMQRAMTWQKRSSSIPAFLPRFSNSSIPPITDSASRRPPSNWPSPFWARRKSAIS